MVRTLTWLVGLSVLAFVRFRVIPDLRAQRGTKRMDTDQHGNYDLDGVSYDPANFCVVAGGDGHAPEPVEAQVEKVVDLHAPAEPKSRSVTA